MSHPYVGRICPYCGRPLQEQDIIAVCDTCGVPQHLACWQQKHACSIPNCPGSIREIISPEVPASPANPPVPPQPEEPDYEGTAPLYGVPPQAEPGFQPVPPRPEEPDCEGTAPLYGVPPRAEPGYCPMPPVYSAPGNRKPPKQKNPAPGGKKKHTGLIITLSVVIPLVLAAAALATIFYFIPLFRYKGAEKDLKKGDYDRAYGTFVELDDFQDSAELAKQTLYEKACALLDDGQYDAAIRQFRDLKKYRDSRDMVLEARYEQAGEALRNEEYETAIDLFEELEDFNNSEERLTKAKYGYIRSHMDNRDEKTYEYLKEFCRRGDQEAYELWNQLYIWSADVSFHLDGDPDSKEYSTVSADVSNLHIIYQVEGGVPGETVSLTQEIILPDGTRQWSENIFRDISGGQVCISLWDGQIFENADRAETGDMLVRLYITGENYPLCEGNLRIR